MSIASAPVLVRPAMMIAGLSLRTSYEKAMTDIGPFWGRAVAADLPRTVPGATSGALIGAYTEYSSDYRGEYTLVIGVPVTSTDGLPSGLVALQIPEGRYAQYRVAEAKNEAIATTWQKIWAEWPDRDKRAYAVDYELYEPGPQGPIVEIFVGIR